ncbi:MAG: alpha-glucosidase C-terminal domain-containing protein, partial [Marinilabilia sp.]
GKAGGEMTFIDTNEEEKVLCFSRRKDGNTVVALFNLSDDPVNVSAEGGPEGTFVEAMNDREVTLPVEETSLQPWAFQIYKRQE